MADRRGSDARARSPGDVAIDVELLLEILRKDDLDAGAEFSNEELVRRVNAYAEAVADLGQAMALVSFWAPPSVARVAVETIAEIAACRQRTNGRIAWLGG